ncbi:hypothetical protein C0J52_19128 [Blattella germanica]|nr:hypothetical protein C0J52_19128 [Blattella germanica]
MAEISVKNVSNTNYNSLYLKLWIIYCKYFSVNPKLVKNNTFLNGKNEFTQDWMYLAHTFFHGHRYSISEVILGMLSVFN